MKIQKDMDFDLVSGDFIPINGGCLHRFGDCLWNRCFWPVSNGRNLHCINKIHSCYFKHVLVFISTVSKFMNQSKVNAVPQVDSTSNTRC